MAFIFCVPWGGTRKRAGTNCIQLAAERGELTGVENIFSVFSLYQRSVIWTLISTGFPLSLVVARLNSKGTPGLNFSRTSPGARPSDCAEVTGGQAAIDNRNKIVLNA